MPNGQADVEGWREGADVTMGWMKQNRARRDSRCGRIGSMRWRGRKVWISLLGPLFFVTFFTAGPGVLKATSFPLPTWATPAIAALGGTLLLIATPLLQSRIEAIKRRGEKNDEVAGVRDATLRQVLGRRSDFPCVAEINDRALVGIHPAIPLPINSDVSLSSELPSYVSRDIDADLHTLLRAKRGNGGLIVLVGRTASGKTRCAYESIKAVLPDWKFCLPGSPEYLTNMIESGLDLSRTVIWLDESQKFFGPGKMKATAMRRLLFGTDHPPILIGTIWPETYTRLRTHLAGDDQEDPNRDAREILSLASRFDVLGFSSAEKERAARIAEIDPRVREAISNGSDIGFTQLLAAAPELIHRWTQGDSEFGQLVITAAIAIRMCGHVDRVSVETLRSVAAVLMRDRQKARASAEWFTRAVDWACEPVRGDISPINPYAREIGVLDGYTVSDVLFQYATESRKVRDEITDEVWETVISTSIPEVAIGLLVEAVKTENFAAAEKAAHRCQGAIMRKAAILLMAVSFQRADKDEKSLEWWQRAVGEFGDTSSMTGVGLQLLKMGRLAEADVFLLNGANRDDANAAGALGVSLMRQGRVDEALQWLRRSANLGNSISIEVLGVELYRQGNKDEAEIWLRQAAEAGRLAAQGRLGLLLTETPESHGEGIEWLQRGAESGDTQAMVILGLILSQSDSMTHGEGRLWLQRALDEGDISAAAALGVIASEDGDKSAAEAWFRKAAIDGHPVAIKELAHLLRSSGRIEDAEHWEQHAEFSSLNQDLG